MAAVPNQLCIDDDCNASSERMELDALDREVCCLKSRIRCLEDKTDAMQADVMCFRGQVRNLTSVNDCFRKELEELKRCNVSLKWKRCDFEKELSQLNAMADCLRQRVRALTDFVSLG